MIRIFLYIAAFLASFLIVGGIAAAVWSLVDGWMRQKREGEQAQPGLLRSEVLSTLSLFAALLKRLRHVERLQKSLAEADLEWSVGRVILVMLVTGTVTLNLLLRLDFIPDFGAWACAIVAAGTPIFYVRRRRRLRLRAVEETLPEALDFLSRALVAGHSLPMSLELLAEEVDPPLSNELRKTVDEYNLGLPISDSLNNLGDRLPMVDVQCFVSAVTTQARNGGNLHELLDTLSETIRERSTLKGQVHAMTANGRLTAVILSLLPFLVGGVMMFVNDRYFSILLEHPLGKTLLFLAMCGQAAAYFVINKIVDIKVWEFRLCSG